MSQSLDAAYDALIARDGLQPDPAQRAALRALAPIRDALEAGKPAPRGLRGLFAKAPEPAKGLYLWGGVGRGKSMLMDLFHRETRIAAKRRVHFHAFMQEIHAGMTAARKRGADDALAPVADAVAGQVRLLCFDEMQISDITDAMIVGRLFERLFAAGVVIVATSNRPPDDLYKDGLNRVLFVPFIELIKARMTVLELESAADYRQHRLEGTPVWFAPNDAAARAGIEEIWRDLTGGAAPEPLTLQVQGRAVTIPAFAGGVARARFWELCGQPLGAADYLALAGAVRVLILEDVPLLSRSNFNEAKRFVTLIDTLYEAGVRLVASAADRPDQLYVEGAGAFEFERTVSRLAEMQSEGWGA